MVGTLTPSQSKVVEFPYLPNSTIKVVAGPGSGKTLTLLHKVYHLVECGQVAPNEILILSLTNKAVDNVITRLFNVFEELNEKYTEDQLREMISGVEIHTIHGLANRVVSENEGIINVIEENGWRGLMKLVSDDFWKNKRPRIPNTRDFKKLFDRYMNDESDANEVVKKLIEIMQNCGVVTNDELIVRASRYLTNDLVDEPATEAMKYTRNLKDKIKVVIIDEFQDLYPSLLPLIRQVSLGKQLILLGDSNQNIYSFLGSNQKVMKDIEDIHKGENFQTMYLHDNFRCTPEIMGAATRVIPFKHDNTNKGEIEIVCKKKCGVEPIIENFSDPLDELDYVTDQISQLVCGSAKPSDIAILTRTNSQMQLISDHLQSYGINSHKLTAQPDWMTDVKIQFLIDLLKVTSLSFQEESEATNEFMNRSRRSDFSIIVTLSALKGVGNQSIQILYNECRNQNMSLWRYISGVPQSDWPSAVTNKGKIVAYTVKLKKLVNGGQFLNCNDPLEVLEGICNFGHDMGFQLLQPKNQHEAEQFKHHLEDMFTILKLCSSNKPSEMPLIEWFLQTHFEQSLAYHHQDSVSANSSQALQISTIHSSKGLEFPIVFLMGGSTWFSSFNQVEDNVLYVGMTRAKNLLYLLNARHPGLAYRQTAKKGIVANEAFWKYYNADLNRAASTNWLSGLKKYDSLHQKYMGTSTSRRPFSTFSNVCIKRLMKLTRRFV